MPLTPACLESDPTPNIGTHVNTEAAEPSRQLSACIIDVCGTAPVWVKVCAAVAGTGQLVSYRVGQQWCRQSRAVIAVVLLTGRRCLVKV